METSNTIFQIPTHILLAGVILVTDVIAAGIVFLTLRRKGTALAGIIAAAILGGGILTAILSYFFLSPTQS